MIETFGWLIVAGMLLVVIVAGYFVFAKIKSGQQPGEVFVDALVARWKNRKAKKGE